MALALVEQVKVAKLGLSNSFFSIIVPDEEIKFD
jgi:hypothetical protein